MSKIKNPNQDRSIIDTIKELFGPAPTKENAQFSLATSMERMGLLEDLFASFEIQGEYPEEWDMEYFKTVLLCDGGICITDTDIGVIPIRCGATGMNVWERPTTCIIANAVVGNFRRTIGQDCAYIHCRPNYAGYNDILDYYAQALANCDGSISVNLQNTRVTFLGDVEDAKDVKAMEKMYDQISEGRPAVFARGVTKGNYVFLNPKQSYIADEIMDLKERLKNEFRERVGIRAIQTDKRERLISSEVDTQNSLTDYNIDHAIKTINKGLEVANRLYGFSLKAVPLSRTEEFSGGDAGADSVQSATVQK